MSGLESAGKLLVCELTHFSNPAGDTAASWGTVHSSPSSRRLRVAQSTVFSSACILLLSYSLFLTERETDCSEHYQWFAVCFCPEPLQPQPYRLVDHCIGGCQSFETTAAVICSYLKLIKIMDICNHWIICNDMIVNSVSPDSRAL